MTRGERLTSWLLQLLPERVAAAPERVLINAAMALIGISTLLGLALGDGPRPASLLAIWPAWLSYEWASAMLLGGLCALVGYLRHRRTTERFGYLLIGIASTLYAASAVRVFGWHALFTAVLFLGIACSKAIRLLVTSAARSSVIRQDEDDRR